MGKGSKAIKRAAKTKDAIRLEQDIPLITDSTEFITPAIAEKMLKNNKSNRPINWNKVEEYAKQMEDGTWMFHAQGIILDNKGNILTGQKRLWAIIYSGRGQLMRISKGTPAELARYIDRGTPQSSRDLAARHTDRKHSPMEQSIARAILAINGDIKPSLDLVADTMVAYSNELELVLQSTRGLKKTKSIYMILGAICYTKKLNINTLLGEVDELAKKLEKELFPIEIKKVWNKGAAFTLAMEKALSIIECDSH